MSCDIAWLIVAPVLLCAEPANKEAAVGPQAAQVRADTAMRVIEPLHLYYLGARKPERSRATDELYLNYHADERHWGAGETISEYEATVQCGVR